MLKFKPQNKTESMLMVLPKQCSCNMCKAIKEEARETLGNKKFKEICKTIGIAA